MLDSFSLRVQGRIASRLQRSVLRSANQLVSELIHLATLDWESSGFDRYDDTEVSCSVRVFDCADRILRRDERWTLFRIQYDGAQPTAAIRAGLDDPNRVPRPDLILSVGSVEFNVEAKRIGVGEPLPRDYVREGMLRFIAGKYLASTDGFGIMLGYALRSGLSDCVLAINQTVCQTPELGAADQLVVAQRLGDRFTLYLSRHQHLRIIHHHLDLR